MNQREFFKAGAAAAVAGTVSNLINDACAAETPEGALGCDVFVYGSTPGGVAAALEAARRGCKVVLACPKNHPGGMAASGLSTTDAVRREMFGGLVIEFIHRVRAIYERTIGVNSPEWPLIHDGWFYAPSVAELAFQELLEAESASASITAKGIICWQRGLAHGHVNGDRTGRRESGLPADRGRDVHRRRPTKATWRRRPVCPIASGGKGVRSSANRSPAFTT